MCVCVQEIKLSQIGRSLVAYQEAARSQQKTYLQHLQHSHVPGSNIDTLPGRFSHCSAEALRLSDLQSMLHEVQHVQAGLD